MAGTPLRRARRRQINGGRLKAPTYPHLAAIYAEKYNSFDALRAAMVQSGIVEHGISPYDAIQRAIDDVTSDYLVLRRKIDQESASIEQVLEHPLQSHCEHLRECMVRYSTFAAQYDIQNKNLRLSEARLALLANGLREIGRQLKLTDEQTKQLPRMLIDTFAISQNVDEDKATALAEILAHDAEVEIIDATAEEVEVTNLEPGMKPRMTKEEKAKLDKQAQAVKGSNRRSARRQADKDLKEDKALARIAKTSNGKKPEPNA